MAGFGFYKKQFRQFLFDKQNGLCFWCHDKMNLIRKVNGQPSRNFATFEHIIRVHDGGKTNSTNMVLAHKKCNYMREIIRQSNNGKNKPKGMRPEKWKTIVEQWLKQ